MTTRACTWRVSAPAGAASTTMEVQRLPVHTSLTTAHRHRRLNGHRRVISRARPGRSGTAGTTERPVAAGGSGPAALGVTGSLL